MYKNYKSSNGITLVALVITIVVLLILAAVTINMVVGEKGIIRKASDAANNSKTASVKEKVQMMLTEYLSDKYIDGKDLTAYLTDKKEKGEIDEFTDNGDGTITIEVDGYEVVVKTDDLNIESVDKVGGVEIQVAATIYQADGSAIVEGTTYDQVAITVKITNKSEFTNVTPVVLKNASGTEISKESNPIGDSSAEASYIVTQGGKYTASVQGTKDGITKEKTLPITVTQISARAGLKVGDYINYTPDDKTASPYTTLTVANTGSSSNSTSVIQDKLKWQILKINEDGSMDLIGSATSQDIYFCGALGYNNGVYLMNDICKSLYSKNSEGITARSVSLEDFEYWLEKSTGGVTARDSYYNGYETYNTSKQYKGMYSYRPDIFGKTENESDSYYTSPTTNTYIPASGIKGETAKTDDTLDVKLTFYAVEINETNYREGYKALTSSISAWIASRYVYCYSTRPDFGLRCCFSNNWITGYYMYDAYNLADSKYCRLRPVVSLGSDVQISASTEDATNPETPHTITQY